MGYKKIITILISAFLITTVLIISLAIYLNGFIGKNAEENVEVAEPPLAEMLIEIPPVNITQRTQEFGQAVVDGYALLTYFDPESFGVMGVPDVIEGPNGESPEELDKLINTLVKPYGFVKEYTILSEEKKGEGREVIYQFTTPEDQRYTVKLDFNELGQITTNILIK